MLIIVYLLSKKCGPGYRKWTR